MNKDLNTQQVRRAVLLRADLLQLSWSPDDPLLAELRRLRDEYVVRVGPTRYVSEMLGVRDAIAAANDCILRWEDGRTQVVSTGQSQIQYYLRRLADDFPYAVEIKETGHIKYL